MYSSLPLSTQHPGGSISSVIVCVFTNNIRQMMTIERDLVQGAMVLPSQGSVLVTSISPAQVSPPTGDSEDQIYGRCRAISLGDPGLFLFGGPAFTEFFYILYFFPTI